MAATATESALSRRISRDLSLLASRSAEGWMLEQVDSIVVTATDGSGSAPGSLVMKRSHDVLESKAPGRTPAPRLGGPRVLLGGVVVVLAWPVDVRGAVAPMTVSADAEDPLYTPAGELWVRVNRGLAPAHEWRLPTPAELSAYQLSQLAEAGL
jgi:hypothetical protein